MVVTGGGGENRTTTFSHYQKCRFSGVSIVRYHLRYHDSHWMPMYELGRVRRRLKVILTSGPVHPFLARCDGSHRFVKRRPHTITAQVRFLTTSGGDPLSAWSMIVVVLLAARRL